MSASGVSAVADGPEWKRYYQPDELVEIGCPLCAAKQPKDIAGEFGITIARCMRCGLVYTRTPLPESQSKNTVPCSAGSSRIRAIGTTTNIFSCSRD